MVLRKPAMPCLLILMSLCGFPAAALAAPLLTLDGFVTAKARVAAGDQVDSDANRLTGGVTGGPIHDARTARAEGNLGADPTVANATFDGTAWFGELRGSASAQAIAGTAIGQVTLRWDDDFLATSSILPFGTPVDYRFTMSLESGIFTNIPCGSSSPPGPAAASLSGNNGAAGIIVDRACPGPPDDRILVSMLHTTIGARVLISGSLTLSASVGSSAFSRPDAQAIVDASHTGRFFLDPVGPDHSYRTSSGLSYLSPIPEPSTLLLLGSGIAAAAARRAPSPRRFRRLVAEPATSPRQPLR